MTPEQAFTRYVKSLEAGMKAGDVRKVREMLDELETLAANCDDAELLNKLEPYVGEL